MGVFENYPYSNFHELNLDWLIRKVKEFQANMDEYEKQYGNLEGYIHHEVYNYLGDDPNLSAAIDAALAEYGVTVEDLEEEVTKLSYNYSISKADRHYQIFVWGGDEATTYPLEGQYSEYYGGRAVGRGNDSNPGTIEAPLKTLQAAFDLAAKWGNGAVIILIGGQTPAGKQVYNWDWAQTNTVDMHLNMAGKYAKIMMNPGKVTERIYNSYFHFQGSNSEYKLEIEVYHTGANRNLTTYLESGGWFFGDCIITTGAPGSYKTAIGVRGFMHCIRCDFNTGVYIDQGQANFVQCTFYTDTSANNGVIYGYAGSNVLINNCTFRNDGTMKALYYGEDSTVTLIGNVNYTFTGNTTDSCSYLAGTNNIVNFHSVAAAVSWSSMEGIHRCTMTYSNSPGFRNKALVTNLEVGTTYGPYPLTLVGGLKFRLKHTDIGGTDDHFGYVTVPSFIPAGELGSVNGHPYYTSPMIFTKDDVMYAYQLMVYINGNAKFNIQRVIRTNLATGVSERLSSLPSELDITAVYTD